MTLRFRAVINPDLLDGTRITNTGTVTWNNPPRTASASVAIDVGGIPGVGHPERQGVARRELQPDARSRTSACSKAGPSSCIATTGCCAARRPMRTACIASAASRRTTSAASNTNCASARRMRPRAPRSWAWRTRSSRTGCRRIRDIIVQFASNLQDLNLPISPNGVAYNSVSRAPAAGVTLRMLSAGTRTTLPAACFDDPAQQNQVTLRGRLLPLRHELLGPGVPERRELPDRRESAADRLHRHVLADHPADLGPVDRRVLGAGMSGAASTMRCRRRRTTAKSRPPSSRRPWLRAHAVPARAITRT